MSVSEIFRTLWTVVQQGLSLKITIGHVSFSLWAFAIFASLVVIVARMMWGNSND